MAIEVFAELACPFTHLALRRIVARRADQGRESPPLWIRPWPLELVNGRPTDPHLVDEEVRALRTQVAPDLFSGFDPAALPSTSMPGLRLVEAAYARDMQTGEWVSLALRDALFELGRDIADLRVLSGIASAHDLDLPDEELDAQVRAAHAEGERRGVQGSPHFFVAGGSQFCPLLAIERDDDGAFHLSLDEAAANAVIDGWFATA